MRFAIIVVGAFILGAYSVAGLHYYSLVVSHTNSVWSRLALYIPAVGLFIFAPMVACGFLLGWGGDPGTVATRIAWLFTVFFCWIGPVYFYLIKNRAVLSVRLRGRQTNRLRES
jgi:hypothetical protein